MSEGQHYPGKTLTSTPEQLHAVSCRADDASAARWRRQRPGAAPCAFAAVTCIWNVRPETPPGPTVVLSSGPVVTEPHEPIRPATEEEMRQLMDMLAFLDGDAPL